MKYIPALAFGLILAILTFYIFQLSASLSFTLQFLIATENLTENSPQWLLLLVQDNLIALLPALLVVSAYRRLLPRFPFNWLTAIFMQLPMIYLTYRVDSFSMKFASLIEVVLSLVSIINCSSVLIIYALMQSVNYFGKNKRALNFS